VVRSTYQFNKYTPLYGLGFCTFFSLMVGRVAKRCQLTANEVTDIMSAAKFAM
jgi:hypothetical protein